VHERFPQPPENNAILPVHVGMQLNLSHFSDYAEQVSGFNGKYSGILELDVMFCVEVILSHC
jgi:hypothetical protein